MKKHSLLFILVMAVVACKDQKKTEPPLVKTATTTAVAEPQASEFADPKFMDLGKQMMQAFEKGNIDQWAANFTDDAVYQWSAGDSLKGKEAIAGYWKDRRTKVIDNIHFTNDIWLPIKVNTPQRGPDMPGVWLLNWYQVNVKYKNGKSLQFWVHNDFHFNNDNKIDRTVQYIDRAPINAALSAK